MKFFGAHHPLIVVTRSSISATVMVLGLIGAIGLLASVGRNLNPSTSSTGGAKDDTGLKSRLTSEQYYVTQESGTEPPFFNAFWNNEKEGIYVDVVTGQPLFSSTDKFDSGTGWPSFTKPIDGSAVVQKSDGSDGMERAEVRSSKGDSHLGHVFDDGPAPTGQRYCINSAALRFIPKDKLNEEGLSKYMPMFQSNTSK